jgi:hypothetical protein
MLAYEIYWLDSIKGYELVGILPERRNNMLFIRRTIDNTTEEIFRLKPSFGVRLEALKANQP